METKEQFHTASGIPVKDIYTPEDVKDLDYEHDIGVAGEPPFTRGVYQSMYRGKAWTTRRLTGYNTPEDSNELYRQEYELGQTGFSVAPDISTSSGMDADNPRVSWDVGHSGVPMNTLQDMETTFAGLPIDRVSTYMADRIGGPMAAQYFVMAEKRGLDLKEIRGTIANDLLAWSGLNLVNQSSPKSMLRLAVDLVEWCTEHTPKWNPVSIDSYNARDNGISAVQELGMSLATAIQYIEEAKRRGRVPLDRFVRRFSFNTAVHNDFFEEIAKLRAARRMWHKIITERYGIQDPACAKWRVHVQTSGSTHTYQEPYNNLMRIAYQVLAGTLGGAQSIHANGYDEAICLPTEQAMLLSIRTGQILQYETNVTNTIDPLGGSWYVESLTNEMEERTWEYIKKIEEMGGIAEAMESGWIHRELRDAILEHERKLASGETVVVGVNRFRLEKEPYQIPIFKPDSKAPDIQIAKLKKLKQERDNAKVAESLKKLEEALLGDENVMPATMEAVRNYATMGELTDVQLKVYGVWRFPMSV